MCPGGIAGHTGLLLDLDPFEDASHEDTVHKGDLSEANEAGHSGEPFFY